jgi:hypothetical protein
LKFIAVLGLRAFAVRSARRFEPAVSTARSQVQAFCPGLAHQMRHDHAADEPSSSLRPQSFSKRRFAAAARKRRAPDVGGDP